MRVVGLCTWIFIHKPNLNQFTAQNRVHYPPTHVYDIFLIEINRFAVVLLKKSMKSDAHYLPVKHGQQNALTGY